MIEIKRIVSQQLLPDDGNNCCAYRQEGGKAVFFACRGSLTVPFWLLICYSKNDNAPIYAHSLETGAD